MIPSNRVIMTLGCLFCIGLLSAAFYFQYIDGLEPCPLCMMQRIAVFFTGVFFLLGAIHNPKGWGSRVYGFLITAAAGCGIGVAGRHVWIQHLPPDQIPECGASFDQLIQVLPLFDAIKKILKGDGECAKIDWQWLGLSMPEWTLLAFIGLTLVGLFIMFRPKKQNMA